MLTEKWPRSVHLLITSNARILATTAFYESGRRDLNPRPPEPHGVDLSGESRQRVATTRCSGHRCCESDPENQPGIVAESQRNSQRATLGPRPVRWRMAQDA